MSSLRGFARAASALRSTAIALFGATTLLSGTGTAAEARATLAAKIDGASVGAETCIGSACITRAFELPQGLGAARVEPLELRDQRAALLIEAPDANGFGRFALLLTVDDEGAPRELLRGWLERPKGVEGARRWRTLLIEAEDGGTAVSFGTRFEELNACGRPSLSRVKKLDVATLEWRAASNRILAPGEAASATRLFAKRRDGALATFPRLLDAKVATSARSGSATALTDGDVTRAWTEDAAGSGSGELVVMSASRDVPIEGFEFVLRGSEEDVDRVAPKSFFVLVGDDTFHVTMPEDAGQKPAGTVYEVMLPSPARTDCVALVLDTAYDVSGDSVGLAELRAKTSFDGARDLSTIVASLDKPGAEARAAMALLVRSRDAAIEATIAGYPSLSEAGRSLALDVIDGGSCRQISQFLVAQLTGMGRPTSWDPDGDESLDGWRQRVRRCPKESVAPLEAALASGGDDRARGLAARELVALSPDRGVPAIADALGGASPSLRVRLRDALGAAARDPRAQRALSAMFASSFEDRPLEVRVELLRSMGSALGGKAGASNAFSTTARSDRSFRTRYLLQRPAGHLARAGDAVATTYLLDSVQRDTDARIRAAAAREAYGIERAPPLLAGALQDASPRVREAALDALASSTSTRDARAIAPLVLHDPWTFVRVAAARTLGTLPGSEVAVRGLLDALDDRSSLVRLAALRAVAEGAVTRGLEPDVATDAANRVHALADDPRLATELRSSAIRAVGKMCRGESRGLLFKLALRAGAPELPYDRELGLAALDALRSLRPKERATELAPLLQSKRVPRDVRAIATEVVAASGRCGE